MPTSHDSGSPDSVALNACCLCSARRSRTTTENAVISRTKNKAGAAATKQDHAEPEQNVLKEENSSLRRPETGSTSTRENKSEIIQDVSSSAKVSGTSDSGKSEQPRKQAETLDDKELKSPKESVTQSTSRSHQSKRSLEYKVVNASQNEDSSISDMTPSKILATSIFGKVEVQGPRRFKRHKPVPKYAESTPVSRSDFSGSQSHQAESAEENAADRRAAVQNERRERLKTEVIPDDAPSWRKLRKHKAKDNTSKHSILNSEAIFSKEEGNG